jgi:hypothetical protein
VGAGIVLPALLLILQRVGDTAHHPIRSRARRTRWRDFGVGPLLAMSAT